MNSVSAQALEEASNIATEFIYSLDNLPAEIRHLSDEIKHIDVKALEIQTSIESECQKYIDLSLPSSSSSSSLSTVKGPNQARIAAAFTQIGQLHHDKMVLAQQMVQLLLRTRARLDVDVGRVRKLQGEPPLQVGVNGGGGAGGGWTFNSNAASQISENLRSVMLPAPVVAPPLENPREKEKEREREREKEREKEKERERERKKSPVVVALSSTPAPATKKRRLNSTPSIKLPARSMSPVAPPPPPPKSARQSRLSRQLHIEEEDVIEAEADGEEEEADDDKPYCFCQKKSFGDMVACDAAGCPYEWFHLTCVGLKSANLGDAKWYCDVCKPKMTGQTTQRRRKK